MPTTLYPTVRFLLEEEEHVFSIKEINFKIVSQHCNHLTPQQNHMILGEYCEAGAQLCQALHKGEIL